MTTGRRQRHPWGISAEQLSHALGHGDGPEADNNDADNGGHIHNSDDESQPHRPFQTEEEQKQQQPQEQHDEMHADTASRGATGSSTCNTSTSSRSNADEGDNKAKAKAEVAECTGTGTGSGMAADNGRIVSGQHGHHEAAFDVIPARPRPSADANINTSTSPSSAERFSYGFDDSASENDNDNESTTGSKASDDEERNTRSDTILNARSLAQQALETQQQQTQEVPISSSSSSCQSSPTQTQRVTIPTAQVPADDEQLALSLLARERKQLQKRRAQAKADERIAREVQSQLDRLSFAESITSSVGDDEEATNRKEKRRQSAEFATLLSSMEDTNMELLRRQRRQQEENDLALARAEQERDQSRHEVKHSSASGGTANADSTTASLSQQVQIDELLARTEAARDEIRLELRNRAVEHDEAVARAEQARERAARDVTDEVMAQTLQEEHIRDHWQQGQEYVPPRPQEEVGQVQADSLSPLPAPLPTQTAPHGRQTASLSPNTEPHSRAASISELENQLLLSGCTVRDVTDTDEVRRMRDLNMRCAVCMEPFVLGDRIRTLPCLHVFHSRCIDQWICLRGKCPIDQNPCL